jgi:hypothetical protein
MKTQYKLATKYTIILSELQELQARYNDIPNTTAVTARYTSYYTTEDVQYRFYNYPQLIHF